ncbi:MAG: hypothetical protein WCD66_07820 [Rhodanobacteraceae bacterium]
MFDLRTLITTTCLGLALVSTASAAVIDVYVTSSADSGPGTLRQAILDANANDLENNGTHIRIQLNNNDPIDLTADLPTITARVITIAGDSAYYPRINGGSSHAMFRTNSSVLFFALRNLDLELGQSAADRGGCVEFVSDGRINIENVSFFGCEARGDPTASGGAIYATGTVQINYSQFFTNYANGNTSAWGGAIFHDDPNGQLTILDSQFNGNHAVAIAVTASAIGGAIYSRAETRIERSALLSNAARTPGREGGNLAGGIYISNGSLALFRSTLISNHASSGGAISFDQNATVTQVNIDLRNNLFVLNVAETNKGGALDSHNGMLSLRNNTFWHNSAADRGDNFYGATNSIIAQASNNLFMAGDGNHDSCSSFTTTNPTTSSVYNVLPAAECGMGAGPGDQITQDVGIIGLEYDAAAPNQSYLWLVQDSPAIEGAYPSTPDDNDPYACPELDGPGNTRPALGIGVPGNGPPVPARCDIGAWESPGEAPLFYDDFEDPLHGYN